MLKKLQPQDKIVLTHQNSGSVKYAQKSKDVMNNAGTIADIDSSFEKQSEEVEPKTEPKDEKLSFGDKLLLGATASTIVGAVWMIGAGFFGLPYNPIAMALFAGGLAVAGPLGSMMQDTEAEKA